jgi:hypothetical protein
MATEAVVARFSEVRTHILALLELRKLTEKAEGDLKVALARKRQLELGRK